ncbi:MAG: hypothetical protein IE885_01440 [Campylobacterales bacterium]|nr:hypothetical protein [Campylobacterales bacterium]
MKRIILGMLALVSIGSAEDINTKWATNENCQACHQNISSKWETSRHSNSHFSKNDLFKKSLEYMVTKKPTMILEEVKVACAECHNPRIAKSEMSKEDKVGLLMDIGDTKENFKGVLNTKTMQNGINCIVCHNVDEIHLDKNKGSRGLNSIKFGSQGTMFGPFDDAVSPYHKTEQRAHFVGDNPQLCFVCHYSSKNENGLEVYGTGKEYDMFHEENNVTEEGCKNCHMSPKRKGVASNFAPAGGSPKERMVREHRFASVDNSNILSDYIDVKSHVDTQKFIINVKNNTPHKIPTGYGLREIILTVKFFNNEDKELGKEQQILAVKWKDAAGEETIPHLAKSIARDTRLDGKASKDYAFTIPQGATYAKYTFSYRLISEDMAKKIGVTDNFFLKEYTFSETRVNL